ncbi:helix-turn-helix transcriptional regulator [Streptomyces sp. NPDC021012]|uniref:helix-turn-helix transcriptional regulator n=1 Tax=Streptomyces sp. NPDC021012 TaxID=3365107 RepID=UPI0037BD3CCC
MKMNKKALKGLLRERRDLIEPADHGLTRPSGPGRRAAGLSQQQVDELTGRKPNTYYRLESGQYPSPPIDYLEQVGRLFGLNEQEWGSLCRYAGIGDPPFPLNPETGLVIPGVWQEAVDGISHMAYVTDASWDLLAYNEQWAELFPGGRVPSNTMRWMLLDDDARNMLLEWKTVWAPLVLPQLRAALAVRPDDETLQQIARDVADDPDLAPIWEAGGAHIHPDGDERPIHHALHGPGHVTMCAAMPLTAPGARLIILIYHPGEKKAHTRLPMLRSRRTD